MHELDVPKANVRVLPAESEDTWHLIGNIFSLEIQKDEPSILSHGNRISCFRRSLILIVHSENTVNVYFMTNLLYLPHDFRLGEREKLVKEKQTKKKS